MARYVIRDGELILKHLAPPKYQQERAPHVISDVMEPTKHMGTGEVIDSKARYRQATRATGCVEVGTDPAVSRAQPMPEPTGIVEDVKRAIAELRSR